MPTAEGLPVSQVIMVTLILVGVAALAWVAVWLPVVGTGLIGCFMGAMAGLFGGSVFHYISDIHSEGVAVLTGMVIGLAIGLFVGGAFMSHSNPRRADPLSRWFLLAGFLGGGIVLWAAGQTWMSVSWNHPPRIVILAGVLIAYVSALALRRRQPIRGLTLMLALDGFALGMVAGVAFIANSWGIEAGAVTGAVIGATVGVIEGLIVGWRYGRGPSVAAFSVL
jgi:hypothetical protein